MRSFIKIFLLFFLFPVIASAQSGVYLSTAVGAGANGDFGFDDREVTHSAGLFGELKVAYQFRVYKKIYSEIGLGGRVILARGKVDEVSFKLALLNLS